jgi:hypothetical protein
MGGGVGPGTSKSLTFTVRKNGSDTALKVVLTGTSQVDAQDLGNSFSVAAGDLISISSVPSGTPTVPSYVTFSMEYVGNTTAESLFVSGSGGNNLSNTAAEYFPISCVSTDAGNGTENLRSQIISAPGTIKNLYINLSAAPGSGKSRAFTLYVNGSATAVTQTISDTATTGNDTTHTAAVVAGDTISILHTPTGTPATANAHWGFSFVATTDGEFNLIATGGDPSVSTTQYETAMAGEKSAGWFASEQWQMVQSMLIKNLYIKGNTAPGAAKSYTFTYRKNQANTGLTSSLSGAAQTTNSNTTNVVIYGDDDKISISSVPSGTPTSPATMRLAVTGVLMDQGAMFFSSD